jgi:elongation factor Ts
LGFGVWGLGFGVWGLGAEATAREEGKPEPALPKIVEGRVNGFFAENVLLEQKFAKDQKKTVQQVLKDAGAQATGFARLRVGQGS